jgi:N6-L-threonylcarbamoyladenine synthase
MKKIGDYEVIGRTKDDAVGEAFDKVARMLDLPYPGGVHIHNLAQNYRARKHTPHERLEKIKLPRPMIHSHDLDFSFSGLKTAVLYTLRDLAEEKSGETISQEIKEEIACEFEDAVTEVLIHKTEKAIERQIDNDQPIQSLILGGGVTANEHIRKAFEKIARKNSISLLLPPPGVSGDNALMIALAAALATTSNISTGPIRAHGNLSL